MAFTKPEKYFSRISHINLQQDLLAKGLRYVILDVDNTILTRDTHEVPRDVAAWLARAREAGVNFCLLSNNWHEGVYKLADKLELPIIAKAVKPLPHGFLAARKKLGAPKNETVVIGDQLITDVFGAHVVGLPAYLLQPLVEADLKHTLILRHLERALMGGRVPEPAVHEFAAVESAAENMSPKQTVRGYVTIERM